MFRKSNVIRDTPVLRVLARLLDDKTITALPTLYKAVNSCLLELRDEEIKGVLSTLVFDCSEKAWYIEVEGKKYYASSLPMSEALESSDPEWADQAAEQFQKDCNNLRNYIRVKYGF